MKKCVLLLSVLFSMTASFAQVDDFDGTKIIKEKKNQFFVGPKVGGVLTTMTQPGECHLSDGGAFGFSGGAAAKARFGRATENSEGGTGFWGVGLELKYKQNTVKTVGTNEKGEANSKLSVGYFEVPVYFHVYPFAKINSMNSFYVELGVSFATAISRSPKSLTVMNPNSEMSQITYNFDTENSTLKGADIRPMAGIGYTIPNTGLDINARYYIGTSELAKNFSSKMSSFEISLAWMFDAFKF